MSSFLKISLYNPEQLDPVVRQEFDQLITALQRWAQKVIPADLIPTQLLAIAVNQLIGILDPSHGGTGVDSSTATDGQLLIGDTALGAFQLHTLTAGPGIVITNGAGTITIEASGGGGGSSWVPLTSGAEPLAFISDGAGTPILVAYP